MSQYYQTGFDACLSEVDGEYNEFILQRMSEVCEPYGLDCYSLAFGESGNMVAQLDINGAVIGSLVFLHHQWGYSHDGENMFTANSIESAVDHLINPYIEAGGFVG